MAFTNDYSNTSPVDHSKINVGPSSIRAVRVDVSDRLATIVNGFTSGETSPIGILKLPFIAVSAPTTVTDQIQLYGKVVGGKTLLHSKDEDGTETVLQGFRTGDILLSSNTTTPPSWTDVSATYANKMIRISATALSTGGADTHTHGAGSYAGPSHTHTFTTGGVSFGGGGSLTAGALDTAHTHSGTTDAGGTGAITGTSAAGDNVPSYVTLKAYSKD